MFYTSVLLRHISAKKKKKSVSSEYRDKRKKCRCENFQETGGAAESSVQAGVSEIRLDSDLEVYLS